MPNRSMRDERQGVDRPRVGPADPATQRKALAEYEAGAKREARERMAKRVPTPAAAEPSPTSDLSVIGAARNLTGRRRVLAEAEKESGA